MANRFENLQNGNITISRWSSSSDDPRKITIRVIDETSGVEFISIALSLEELALALTGLGNVDCAYSVQGLRTIGRKAESKEALVPYADAHHTRHDPKALAALEVNGWKVRESDLKNHHCFLAKGIRCVFFRHVGKGLIE